MTVLAKLTEAVEHAYKNRTENTYLEALPEIGSCNIRHDNNFTLKATKETL